jgi:type I restriction enzyme, S subunit
VAALHRVGKKLAHYHAAVLKAAVEGGLTEFWRQHHTDVEPASSTLLQILAERRRIWEQDQIRKFTIAGKEQPKNWRAKYKEPVEPDPTKLPQLPTGWIWASLDQLSVFVTSGSRGWNEYYAPEGALFVRSQDIRTDRRVLDSAAHVRPPKNSEGSRTELHRGDLLATITGANVAKAALVNVDICEAYVSQHVGLVRLVDPQLGDFGGGSDKCISWLDRVPRGFAAGDKTPACIRHFNIDR